jgi:anti-sigma-K factor RskA
MNIRHNDQLREKLAAEYALGTLKGAARRRFEKWMKDDAALRRAVAEWQDRLQPMAEFASPVQPSPQVWRAIEKRLDLRGKQAAGGWWSGLRDSLGFWRAVGVGSSAIAAILVAVLLTKRPEVVTPTYVATLADDKSQTAMVITGDVKHRQLIVKVVAPQAVAADKSLELWAVPKQGSPRALGLVANNGVVTLPLPENATPQSVPLLAVSLEPKGGSPNPNAPTGPILFKGAWVQI